jgi:hypothetical protein
MLANCANLGRVHLINGTPDENADTGWILNNESMADR